MPTGVYDRSKSKKPGPISEEARKKMSEAKKGRKLTKEHSKNISESLKGRLPWNTGKKTPLKTREKMSEYRKGNQYALGVKHTDDYKINMSMVQQGIVNRKDWKGFTRTDNFRIRNSPEYKAWRTEVFKKDNYTCQDCGQVGGYLNAHHIMDFALYPKYRFVVEFGHTLCKKCHKELHKRLREYRKVS